MNRLSEDQLLKPSCASKKSPRCADMPVRQEIDVLFLCHNEELAVGRVIADFRGSLPTSTIFIYDNNSIDQTGEIAIAGAQVKREIRQGKGYVVRRMFSDIEADIYVLVDGDAAYDAGIPIICERADPRHGCVWLAGNDISSLSKVLWSRKKATVIKNRSGFFCYDAWRSNFETLWCSQLEIVNRRSG